MKNILLILCAIITLISCKKETEDEGSTLPELNGTYAYESNLFRHTYSFDKTRKVKEVFDINRNSVWMDNGTIWSEWKVEGTTYYSRLWSSKDAVGFEEKSFKFIDAFTIEIGGVLLHKVAPFTELDRPSTYPKLFGIYSNIFGPFPFRTKTEWTFDNTNKVRIKSYEEDGENQWKENVGRVYYSQWKVIDNMFYVQSKGGGYKFEDYVFKYIDADTFELGSSQYKK